MQENRFKDVPLEEIEERFYVLLEEIDDAGDDVSAKVLAELYRELADAIEMIGEHEEKNNG